MSLSCSCDHECEMDLGDWCCWLVEANQDFINLNTTKRKRCRSCNELIDINALCLEFPRMRQPYNEIEVKIYSCDPECLEEPPIRIANHYICEKCGEIYLNLTAIGYECISPSENMSTLLKQYQDLSGFKS